MLVDVMKDFEALDVSTSRDAADASDKEAVVNCMLHSHQCTSATGGEKSVTTSQGSALGICMDLPDDVAGVTFKEVLTMLLNQNGGGSTSPVANGVPNSLTAVDCTCFTGKTCFVKTMVMSAFFDANANDANIAADGTVMLKFGRRLRHVVADARSLEETGREDDAQDFEVVIAT